MTTLHKRITGDLLNLTLSANNSLRTRLVVVGSKFSKLFLILFTLNLCVTSLLAQGGKAGQAGNN